MTYLDYLCRRAEEWFTRGRYLIKFRSYGITNVQGRGRNGLTLQKCFWVILLNSSFGLIFAKDHGHFFFLSFLKDKLMSSMNSVFSEGVFEEILTLFEVDRHTVEILG